MVWGGKDLPIPCTTGLAWLAKFFFPPRWEPVRRLILRGIFSITSGCKKVYKRVGSHELDYPEGKSQI